jgi:hypothetical protein
MCNTHCRVRTKIVEQIKLISPLLRKLGYHDWIFVYFYIRIYLLRELGYYHWIFCLFLYQCLPPAGAWLSTNNLKIVLRDSEKIGLLLLAAAIIL